MTPARGWRVGLLAAVVLAAAVVTGTLPPLRQDPAYHDFADQRAILGGPHGANVLSNAGFLLAGAWALVRVRRAALPGWERVAGVGFGLALVLTGVGSAWYHAAPSSATLVWDRLPLAALPATVLAVAVGDRVGPAAGRALLAPLALAAVGSVLWWQRTDDLRAYALAQFLPLLLVPLMLALLPGRRPAGPLLAGLALYGTARLAEAADRAVFLLGGVVSGHTLKHLLAAAAAVLVPWPLGSASPARESPGDYSTQGARP